MFRLLVSYIAVFFTQIIRYIPFIFPRPFFWSKGEAAKASTLFSKYMESIFGQSHVWLAAAFVAIRIVVKKKKGALTQKTVRNVYERKSRKSQREQRKTGYAY